MKKYLMAAGLAILLAGCGNGGSDGQEGASATPAGQQGGGSGNGTNGDSFVAAILNLFRSTSEDGEPVSVESFEATAPEDTEPQPLS